MVVTDSNLQKLRVYATLTNSLDKYVYLKKDDKGMYIEYAFKEGAPHDNRCLSWYDSYQEEAYIRNGWAKNFTDEERRKYLDNIKKARESRIGEVFKLQAFTCGFEENEKDALETIRISWESIHPDEEFCPENHICKVGKPAKECFGVHCKYWTYQQPVKCACWNLVEIHNINNVSIPIDVAVKLFDEIKSEIINYDKNCINKNKESK